MLCYVYIALYPHLNGTVLQAAYLHVLTDLVQSIGVAIAGMVRIERCHLLCNNELWVPIENS
jgi:Co/Zn/Cd efflux system component